MKVAVGCDHAGFALKAAVAATLRELGAEVQDLGTHDQRSVDYVDYGRLVAETVARGAAERGVAICGSGIGMSIVANKVQGIRAALCFEVHAARLSREHNDANVLCLGARLTGEALAEAIVRVFVETPFSGGRHAQRVARIAAMERAPAR